MGFTLAIAQPPGDLGLPEARLGWLRDHLATLPATDLLLLPELFHCGYNIGDALPERAEPRDGPFARAMADLARQHGLALAYGYAEAAEGRLYNSAQCLDKSGQPIGHHRKLTLPPGYEADHFTRGAELSQFTLGGLTCGFLICYDVEFPENTRAQAMAGCDLILVPTALGGDWGVVSRHLIPTRAFENGAYVAYADHAGAQNGHGYFGGSVIADPWGTPLARAAQTPGLIRATLDPAQVSLARARLPYLRDRAALPSVTSTP
ncbi:carbon-nitrogen hydrolase family protein [Roseovarius sp. CH_XMU1461]|uniref:carbon-nitrogen hydrolase family protein n=1 Tax=Roseovarius sp. CH_XMU1461 TaxID=3107777 RepID=UPI00300BF188